MRKDWTPSTVTYIARSSYPALFVNDLALFLCHTGRPVDQRGDVDYICANNFCVYQGLQKKSQRHDREKRLEN